MLLRYKKVSSAVLTDAPLTLLSVSGVAAILITTTTQRAPLRSQPGLQEQKVSGKHNCRKLIGENITFQELYLLPSPLTLCSFYLLPSNQTHSHSALSTETRGEGGGGGELTSLRLGLMRGLFWPFILWYRPQALHR